MKEKTQLRRKLRQNSTPAEKILWSKLRRKNLGYKFRRQHSIGNYIVDFYCSEVKLIIEIDGEPHLQKNIRSQDNFRDAFCMAIDRTVLRFSNDDVLNRIDWVVEQIQTHCMKLKSPS